MTELTGVEVGVQLAQRTILSGLEFTARPGELVAFVGPSGCGKTTALNVAGLLSVPTGGDLLIDGEPTRSWKDGRRRRFWATTASFVFQDLGLVSEDSVRANVRLALEGSRVPDRAERVERALAEVGLADRGRDPVVQLSGGERQRVAIARAIAKQARCIFADEPTASLDAGNRQIVHDLLRARADAGVTVLIATHDAWLMERCDQVVQVGAA